jgi:hypothetical protein
MICRRTSLGLSAALLFVAVAPAATETYEQSPMNYSASQPNDAITRLQARIASGEAKLGGRDRDMLQALMQELKVPVESQVLVFSKTSLQRERISPDHPRALYFSDNCYLGWVPSGLVEVTVIDPLLGPIFYQLDPDKARTDGAASFKRDSDCLRCHGGTFVRDIPAVFVRSLHTDANGEMLLRGGSEVVDFRTPFTNRWGGWYVTGKHGSVLHRGNVFTEEKNEELVVDFKRGANVTKLDKFFDTSRYLTNSSDILALLVLEHQTAMQNTITRAGMNCRRMLEYQAALQRELKETSTNELAYESVRSVFAGAVRDIVDDLLFYREAELPAGLQGALAFQRAFQASAPRAANGQTLKDFSLEGRLFQNRCSYLIYSESFLALPAQLKKRVYARLEQLLTGPEAEPRYAHLESAERAQITRILRETHPEFRTFLAATSQADLSQETRAARGRDVAK